MGYIVTTLQEILNAGEWDKYCEKHGVNPWCINEGLATGEEEVELSIEEAKEYGIIN